MTSAQEQPKSRRRWPLPRFSLAAALVAMTLCAVGLWYWYRVPFEVVHTSKGQKEVETVRRTWGGTVRHGPRRIYRNGKLYLVEHYRDGIPHGKWEWLNGTDHAYITAEFRQGRLDSFQASAECDQRLARHLAEGTIDNPELIKKLFEPTAISFTGTPLKDALQILKDIHMIEITGGAFRPVGFIQFSGGGVLERIEAFQEPDQRLLAEPAIRDRLVRSLGRRIPKAQKLEISRWEMPVTMKAADNVPLIVALGKILQPQQLACDFRHGTLWIDERDEAENWTDLTGISELDPPAGSPLAAMWNSNSRGEFIETPLRRACEIHGQMHGTVAFDWSRIPEEVQSGKAPRSSVTVYLSGVAYKHVLGAILERTGCRAHLDGETIVIELQPDHPLAEKP